MPALWYIGKVEAELEGGSHVPYWAMEGTVFYTFRDFVVGIAVCVAVFLILAVRFGPNWTTHAKLGFGLVSFLLVAILIWWPFFDPQTNGTIGSPDSSLSGLLTWAGIATVVSLPILLFVGSIAIFGGSLLVKVLCPAEN